VSGDRERAVLLVRNLETSQRFLLPRLASEQAQTQEGSHTANVQMLAPGAVQFDILSGYNPLPATPVKATKGADRDASVDSDDKPAGPRTKKTSRPGVSGGKVTKAPAQKGAPR
jgi:type IV pilus assembly protein PilN